MLPADVETGQTPEEVAMKLKTLTQALMISGGVSSFGAPIVSAEAQQIPSSAVACYLVGRVYFDNAGNAQVAGYFSDINGIGASDTLFNGTPGERTAFFTFRSDPLTFKSLSNGDITLFLGSAGKYNIYYNPNPQGDWSNPDSFSAGQKFPESHPIAQFMRPEFLDLQFESFSFSQHAITETLVASQDFIFDGAMYNFNQLTPGGITLYNYVSNKPLPAVAGFPLVLPYAGNCVAVAERSANEQ
jgi:hypothetical protein